jgi:hypothetical protein
MGMWGTSLGDRFQFYWTQTWRQYIKQWRSSIYIYVLPKYYLGYSIYKQLGKGSTILYCCDTVAIIGDYTFIFHSIPLVPKHLTISTNGLPSFLQLVSNPKYQLTSLLKRLLRAQVTQRPKWTLSARTATLLSFCSFTYYIPLPCVHMYVCLMHDWLPGFLPSLLGWPFRVPAKKLGLFRLQNFIKIRVFVPDVIQVGLQFVAGSRWP